MSKRPSVEQMFPGGLPEGAKSLAMAMPGEVPAAPEPARRSIRPLPAFAILERRAIDHPGRWEVTIWGWRPTTLNTLIHSHPAKASRLKRLDAIRLGSELRAAGCPTATGLRRLGLTVILGYRQRGVDPDAFDKSLRDGLVRCGALVDDSRRWLDPEPTRYEKGPVMGTRITLEDA